ncbi:MAG: division/cell wall cluster transcriptional repressor MraZ [Clostridia bacterium]|nr:division/cell wall cluster transcriptional repressor MraZ [Clostridia bacterium]
MLIGGSDHSVDKKGRIFIPSRFKSDFGESVVVCACVFGKKCLWGFSEEGFERFCDKLNKQPYGKMQNMYRHLSDTAAFAYLDASGRILLPAELREFAGITSDVHIVGMKNNIEIWSPENWSAEKETFSSVDYASIIDEIGFSFGE